MIQDNNLSQTGNMLLTIYSIVFWAVLIWLIARGIYRPLGVLLVIAAWKAFVEPVAASAGLAASRRRSKLIARFLQRAEDLRMRDKPVEKFLPGRTGSSRGAGEGGIAG